MSPTDTLTKLTRDVIDEIDISLDGPDPASVAIQVPPRKPYVPRHLAANPEPDPQPDELPQIGGTRVYYSPRPSVLTILARRLNRAPR